MSPRNASAWIARAEREGRHQEESDPMPPKCRVVLALLLVVAFPGAASGAATPTSPGNGTLFFEGQAVPLQWSLPQDEVAKTLEITRDPGIYSDGSFFDSYFDL